MGLNSAYVRDISKILVIRWGVFKIGLFWYGQCAISLFKSAHMHPAKIIR